MWVGGWVGGSCGKPWIYPSTKDSSCERRNMSHWGTQEIILLDSKSKITSEECKLASTLEWDGKIYFLLTVEVTECRLLSSNGWRWLYTHGLVFMVGRCVCECLQVCVHVNVHVNVSAHAHACMCACVYVCACEYVSVCTYASVLAYTTVCVHVCVHVRASVCTGVQLKVTYL